MMMGYEVFYIIVRYLLAFVKRIVSAQLNLLKAVRSNIETIRMWIRVGSVQLLSSGQPRICLLRTKCFEKEPIGAFTYVCLSVVDGKAPLNNGRDDL